MEILLNNRISKQSVNKNSSLGVNLYNTKRLLPIDDLRVTINEIELYNSERKSSSSIRLVCTINTICSNLLFNPITEIVKDEGSDNCVCLNFEDKVSNKIDDELLIHKNPTSFTNINDCIRDTQLSNNKNNFIYNCGVDIFNNHILRSNSFKSVCPLSSTTETLNEFNTIKDFSRTLIGEKIYGYSDTYQGSENVKIPLHLYLNDDILSFEDCISQRLIEENGWFGFKNRSLFETISDDSINKVINNKKSCDFVDLYPSRDLFSFVPKYNKHRKRLEKNWNYCITYPSSSTTNVDFISEKSNSLMAYFVNFNVSSKNGVSSILIHSISKHGLLKNDNINLYNNDELILKDTYVINIVDDYRFYVYKNGLEDNDYNNISFKKVINGDEVNYYVRIFSKLPNWKFSKTEVNEYEIYKNGSNIIKDNQIDFENHLGKLSFSKNIFNDDIAEIVFTDDINIDSLRDNLGRPLTSIYLTILKNNSGYKEWYNNHITSSSSIEYSHCFGELTCGFEYDVNYDYYDKLSIKGDIKKISPLINDDKHKPLERLDGNTDKDNIDQNDIYFYGDLCYYSDTNLSETIIQPICFRFNTAQRDCTEFNKIIEYDEISSDDYDFEGFNVKTLKINNINTKEGYYYYPHFEIPFKTFDSDIIERTPIFLSIRKIDFKEEYIYEITTLENHNLFLYDSLILTYKNVNDNKNEYECGKIVEIFNNNRFLIKFDNLKNIDNLIIGKKLIKKDSSTPSYAKLSTKDTCMYRWRNVIENGFDKFSNIEEYPFTNGHFYINKNFNLYLKRQDPSGHGGLKSTINIFDINDNTINKNDKNNYYNHDEITC